ncbi:YcnI family protein [Schumannella sp. 10F1B-5-1]|uniref:YcnI family copper-binding membrane protein n=1 Tax=Schumannella sp. 10F1B-5-1 TaxID=2590780 RepID=UPI00113234D5|nr:YcnI family protein [Schumannella sp. 10F1B-5-1]TPW70140.1 YcnI family protein [Schumannella sp. 10F1B-5-1]
MNRASAHPATPSASTTIGAPLASARRRRPLALGAAALGAGALLALAAPLAASAHVTVNPNSADAGGYATVNVKVPTESDTASTTRVELDLPTDTPLSYVAYQPVDGWTAQLVKEKLPKEVKVGDSTITEAYTHVIWTATGAGLAPGEFTQFPLTIGPVPDVDSLSLPAHQTYSDGSVVDWDETTSDAENPAPTLYVNEAPPADEHGGAHADADTHSDADASDATAASSTSQPDVLARVLGVAGLVVGVIGLIVGALGISRARRGSGAA